MTNTFDCKTNNPVFKLFIGDFHSHVRVEISVMATSSPTFGKPNTNFAVETTGLSFYSTDPETLRKMAQDFISASESLLKMADKIERINTKND